MLLLLALGIGIGWGFQTNVLPSSSGSVTTTGQVQGTYSVTLVLTTGSIYNSTVGNQPAFFVLTSSGLKSSANIAFPANTLIKLTIVNYDDGNASLASNQYTKVQGTVNGTMTFANNDNVNATQGASGIILRGGETVSNVSADMIAHTFTVPTLNINIPIPVSSTVVAYIKIAQTGSFTWYCETACGAGTDGILGAMDTPGWMTGNLEVS
jgi:heme/copper-type cytochrome/quinol oxidase subunit 2